MTRNERKDFGKRWRKNKERALPSSSVIRRYIVNYFVLLIGRNGFKTGNFKNLVVRMGRKSYAS